MELIKEWFQRHFSNPQVVFLALFLVLGFLVVIFLGNMLTPVLASLVIAYLLDGIVMRIQEHRVPRLVAVLIVYLFFMISFLLLLLGVIPNMVQQLQSFIVNDLPGIVRNVTSDLQKLERKYVAFKQEKFFPWLSLDEKAQEGSDDSEESGTPDIHDSVGEAPGPEEMESEMDSALNIKEGPTFGPPVSGIDTTTSLPEESSIFDYKNLTRDIERYITQLSRRVLSYGLGSITSVVTFLVYLVLVPVLVFFFLKDKERIIGWFSRFLPQERALAARVWRDVNLQTSNYIRGKFWEIIIVWSVTHVTFTLFRLEAALILSLLVGLSVLVPYVGATVMYIPISLIAFYQYGGDATFVWILIAYTVIQILDGNVLVPILLSEVTNLHPIAIIAAILVFGGIWGFWGVFFAIPLATLVNAVINAWPKNLPRAETPAPVKEVPEVSESLP